MALQSLLGNSSNRQIRNFGLRAFFDLDIRKESQRGKSELQYIKGFNERYNTSHYGYGRLSDYVNTKTFYQKSNNNIVDLTNDFEKTPSIDEVKSYVNEIVENGTKFATLSPDWFVDIKGGAKKKDHIIKSSNFKNMNKAEKKRHNKYIMSLEKLLVNAEYAGEKENTKKDKKPNVEKYHYFKTDVKIGNKTYQLIFDTEEYKNDKSSLSANVLRPVKNLNEDTNSINDNSKNFNPKTVHLYNIKEIKNPKEYYQKTNESFIDKIKKIFSNDDKKISDFQKMNEYSDIKDFFDDIKDIKVKNLTKDIAKQLGVNENNLSFYDKNNNVIYINYDITKKLSSTAFNHSLFHEIIHAKQRMMYNFAKENLNNNALSSEIKNELKTYINYLDEDSKVISDFVNYIKAKNVSDVSQLDSRGIELYNKYKFSSTEVDADNFAIALQYFRGERNDKGLQQFNRGLESGRDSSYFRGEKQNDGIQKRTYEAIKEFNARQKHSNERLSDYTTYYQELEDESYRGYFQPEAEVVGEE